MKAAAGRRRTSKAWIRTESHRASRGRVDDGRRRMVDGFELLASLLRALVEF